MYDANYNLQLGMLYIANLVRLPARRNTPPPLTTPAKTASRSGSPNGIMKKFRSWSNPFPFSQTREYVQIVLRNAAVYRMIYGSCGGADSRQ